MDLDKEKRRMEVKERILEADKTLPDEDYPFPLYIIIEPTNICNLSCAMCPSKNQKRERGVMKFPLWKKIIDEVAEKSPQTIIWPAIMGESLVIGGKFIEMLRYAKEKKLTVIWNTNAVLLDDITIKELIDLELKEIIVGLDAFSEETYKNIRCGGIFSKAKENTIKLIEASKGGKTKITVQFIIQEDNRQELDLFKKYWLSKGALVKLRPMLGWGEGMEAPELVLEQNERVGRCPWLVRTVSIHWNGEVVQCDADWDQRYAAGNVKNNSIEEIWQNELARRRRRHRCGDFDFHPCKTCKDWQAGISQYYYPDEDIDS